MAQEEKSGCTYCVSVTFAQGRNLTSRDRFGKGDPYCKLTIDDQTKKTSYVSNSSSPVWNQRLDFTTPNHLQKLTVEVFDHDKRSKDDLIGSKTISLSKSWDVEHPRFKWIQITTKTKHGKVKVEGEIQLQIVCKQSANPDQLQYFQYSHLLHIDVEEAEGLPRMDLVGQNDSFAVVQWGSKSFRTKVLQGKNPVWSEHAFLFVNHLETKGFQLKIGVRDKDIRRDDLIGEGYISAKEIFSEGFNGWVSLSKEMIDKDTELGHLNERADVTDIVGRIRISANVTPRDELENLAFSELLDEYDENHNGFLGRDEARRLIHEIAPNLKDFDLWFNSLDSNKDGELDHAELKKYMGSTEFENSDLMQMVIRSHFLNKTSVSSSMMTDYSKQIVASERNQLTVLDRISGVATHENIPGYISFALKAMFSSRAGRIFSKRSKNLVRRLSERQGRIFDSPESTKEIPAFVKLHELNVDELELSLDKFGTFNDFFARAIKPKCRPIASPDDPSIAVSSADCRMMVFPNIIDASTFWIKGDQFNVENLLCDDNLAKSFLGGSLVIARLSPQDYHRWHMPVTGTHGKITPISGALYTVNPIAINQAINVYTKNKRCIVEIDSKSFGKVLLIAVAATMVGSYRIFGKPGEEWKKGSVHGEFRFGGSTTLILFEPGRIQFDADLLQNSKENMETLLHVNTRIGCAIPA